MSNLDVVVSKNGVPIRLTHERWAHIVESHDYMAGNIDLVLETISDPDYIIRGSKDEIMTLKHYGKTTISEKDVVVIYKEFGNDGFVITAFMTSKKEKLLGKGIIWHK